MIWRFKLWRIKRRERAFERAWSEYQKTITPPVMRGDRVAFLRQWEGE